MHRGRHLRGAIENRIEQWTPADERPQPVTETLSWHPLGAATAFTLDLPVFVQSVFDTD